MKNDNAKFKNEFKKRVYHFALKVIAFLDALPDDRICRILGDQLLRSATSIGANVAEAEAASSKKDYTNYFSHSLKSANETKFWLGLLKDSGRADKSIVYAILGEVTEISNILGASVLTLKGKR